MKRTGSATAAAAIALHGFRTEVQASLSWIPCFYLPVTVGSKEVYVKTETESMAFIEVKLPIYEAMAMNGNLAGLIASEFTKDGETQEWQEGGAYGGSIDVPDTTELNLNVSPSVPDEGTVTITWTITKKVRQRKDKPCPGDETPPPESPPNPPGGPLT